MELPFPVREELIACGDLCLRLVVPADKEAVFEAFLEAEDAYWSELWPSALAFARLLVEDPPELRGPVLDLGTGLGLTALVLAATGHEVTATDASAVCLQLVEESARRNGLTLQTRRYRWGEPAPRRFASIVGADLLYEVEQHAALRAALSQTAAADAQIWLADPDRPPSRAFFAALDGWRVESRPLAGRVVLHRLARA